MLSGVVVGFVLGVLAWWVAAHLIYRSPRLRERVARFWGADLVASAREDGVSVAVRPDTARELLALEARREDLSASAWAIVGGVVGFAQGRARRGAALTWAGTSMFPEECSDLLQELRDGVGLAALLTPAAVDELRLALAEAVTGHACSLYRGHGRWISCDLGERGVLYALRCDCEETRPGLDDPRAAETTARAVGWDVTPHAVLCPTCRQIRDDGAREVMS